MKVFLIDNDKITKFNLPNNTGESYVYSYTSMEVKDVLISFNSIDNDWYLKSNGTVNIIENNQIIDQILIEEYKRYYIKIVGKNTLIELYFFPLTENLYKISFENLNSFSIGTKMTCHISYDCPYLTEVQATFKIVNDEWVISCVNDNNYKVYVNNSKIIYKKLKFGDTIFLGGLKLVWMKKFFCINNPHNNLRVIGMVLMEEPEANNIKIMPVSEEEKFIELYKKDEYFVHYPLIRENLEKKEVTIDAPPQMEKENNLPWILSMGSTITMSASSFAMAYNVSYGISQGREMAAMIPQMVMCISMLIGGILLPRIANVYQKKKRREREILRKEKYTGYLNKKSREIELLLQNELQVLNNKYLTTSNCLIALNQKNSNFWWCQYDDEEFLSIRLGSGRQKTNVSIKAPEEHFTLDDDELLENVYKLTNRYQYIENTPVYLSLKKYNVSSLICSKENKDKYVNELLIQLLTMHSSLDLKIIIMTNEERKERWAFTKFLPHIFSEDLGTRFFVTNLDEAKIISNYLVEQIKERKENENHLNVPYYLIISDDYKNYKSVSIIDEIVNNDLSELGISLLVIENNIKQVPISSKAFIKVGENDGVIIEKQMGLNSQLIFRINASEEELDMESIVLKLADVPVMSKDGPSVLPSSLSFLDMFGVSRIEQLNVSNRWVTNNPVVSLDTVVGVHANGDKFKLDLHEKFHGPHGLIAGSTGSGKSEFIISYILSLIINYHPDEVKFVLIDYKGGGLAGAFENKETGVKIPHLAGTITNLDESEMNRSLVSIQSELKRRQRMFNEVRDRLSEGTIDIYKYQKLYREGVVEKPLSHLFIICDEFAELKQQKPEFMEQLISTSRIGRSLGIHLILATQKPTGVVNDQIWANSKFKVCLKVQEKSDSMEMLKRPEAASIKEAGRFYLQVGYDDYFDIGQSGWSGAKYIPTDRIVQKVDDSINYIDNIGYVVKTVKDVSTNEVDTKNYGDQLTNIVKYIYDIGQKENITVERLWLDPIPAEIYVNDLIKKYNYSPKPYYINPIIGEYDDPVNQLQMLLNIDLSKKGNLIIYGTPGSGKENLLTNLIRSIVVEHTPDEVNIYILDCGSESLKIFENMPHVGEVVTIEEDEKINDFFKFAENEILKRKDLFAEYAGSYNEYITHSNNKLPLLIFVINNYDTFNETYPRIQDNIQSLYRDGAKYGVVFIITVISSSAIRMKATQYFTNKLGMKMSLDDYRYILNAPRGLVPANIFGRGIINLDHGSYEFQTSTFAPRSEYTSSLRELSQVLNDSYITRAPKIPSIPEVVQAYDLATYMVDLKKLPIGYNYDTKNISYIDFKLNSIIPILSMNFDKNKVDFVNGLLKILSIKNSKTFVFDYLDVLKKEIANINLYKTDLEKNLIDLIKNISIKAFQEEVYIFIMGVSKLKKELSQEVYDLVNVFFNKVKKITNVNILILDNYNSFKEIISEKWYSEIKEDTGIWLGENITIQNILDFSNLTMEEKRLNFKDMGYITSKGQIEIIKHVVDRGDENEK